MKIKELIRSPKNLQVGFLPSFLIVFLFSLAMTTFNLLMQTNGFAEIQFILSKTPLVFLLNFLPVFLTTLFLYFLFGSLKYSVLLNYILYAALTVINRTKILYRDEPINPSDFTLGIEGLVISMRSKYQPDMTSLSLFLVLLILLFFFFLWIRPQKPSRKIRLFGSLSLFLILILSYQQIYKSSVLYHSIPVVGFEYNEKDNSESKGMIYHFIHHIQYTKIPKPKNYSPQEFEHFEPSSKAPVDQLPHVLMIMGEAFTDLSALPIFDFSDTQNPIQFFEQLQREALISGHIVTPTFGGGTADTEFDVLTACMTFHCAPNETYSFNAIRKDMPSVVQVLNAAGYHTRAFHPGYPWFYKRQSVYPHLGFSESFFSDSLPEQDIKGGYLSEDQTYEVYWERFQKTLERSDVPIFDYLVTIQNHGPYAREKYGHILDFSTTSPLSRELYECLGSYFEGIQDMDRQLGRLRKELIESQEPFLLIFYGDHLPAIAEGMDGFSKIGLKVDEKDYESELNYYSTPFIIWANAAGKTLLKDQLQDLPKKTTISSNYLGALLLELLGLEESDPFIAHVNRLRRKLPIISKHYIFDGKTSHLKSEPPEENDQELEKYYRWQYHRITNPKNRR